MDCSCKNRYYSTSFLIDLHKNRSPGNCSFENLNCWYCYYRNCVKEALSGIVIGILVTEMILRKFKLPESL